MHEPSELVTRLISNAEVTLTAHFGRTVVLTEDMKALAIVMAGWWELMMADVQQPPTPEEVAVIVMRTIMEGAKGK